MLPLFAQVGPFPTTNLNISDPSVLTAIYQNLVGQWFGAMAPYAYEVFGSLAVLEISVFGWNLWMNYGGDIRAAMMATANKVLILGFFFSLLINGQQWMGDIINIFVSVGKAGSGIPSLSPSSILMQGLEISGRMLSGAAGVGLFTDIPSAFALLVAALFVMAAFLVITFQFVTSMVQTYLALGMGYFFLCFGASRWTTPYVERYFAFSFSAGAKLMALYLLTGAGWVVSNSWVIAAQNVALSHIGVETAWLICCGAILYAGIVWHLSSLVGNFFGAGPNLGHGDAIAMTAPMVGAAVTAGMIAAGVATGGASVAAAGASGKAAGSGAIASMAGGAGRTSGATPPQPSAPSSNGGGAGASAGKAAGQMAQAIASAARQMPHGGGHSSPPTFNGFHH